MGARLHVKDSEAVPVCLAEHLRCVPTRGCFGHSLLGEAEGAGLVPCDRGHSRSWAMASMICRWGGGSGERLAGGRVLAGGVVVCGGAQSLAAVTLGLGDRAGSGVGAGAKLHGHVH